MANEQTEKKMDIELENPADFTSPEELYKDLIRSIRKYHPSDDISLIEKAYKVAHEAHKDQKRKSGEPYIIHPLCVAIILADLEMDKETIAAGILHDVVEDTVMTLDELSKEFGPEVALLVDGVTKLTQLSWSKDKVEMQAENLRKMFLAMAKDIRVILIKLADRLHNMRTLQYMKPEKQKEKARETMEIYAPIAHRLGISKIKVELDDLSLKYLQPDVYYDLAEKRFVTLASLPEQTAKLLPQAVRATFNGRVVSAEIEGCTKDTVVGSISYVEDNGAVTHEAYFAVQGDQVGGFLVWSTQKDASWITVYGPDLKQTHRVETPTSDFAPRWQKVISPVPF